MKKIYNEIIKYEGRYFIYNATHLEGTEWWKYDLWDSKKPKANKSGLYGAMHRGNLPPKKNHFLFLNLGTK